MHVSARLGQFLRVVGHLLEDVGFLCELQGQSAEGICGSETTGEAEEGRESAMMQTTDSTRRRVGERASTAIESPGSHPTERRGTRQEELSAEDIAIMFACERDETWNTLRSNNEA